MELARCFPSGSKSFYRHSAPGLSGARRSRITQLEEIWGPGRKGEEKIIIIINITMIKTSNDDNDEYKDDNEDGEDDVDD